MPLRSSPRLRVRLTVRLRKEGGSLSVTIPRFIVRKWKLAPGDRLVMRSTHQGVMLYPRNLVPVLYDPPVPD